MGVSWVRELNKYEGKAPPLRFESGFYTDGLWCPGGAPRSIGSTRLKEVVLPLTNGRIRMKCLVVSLEPHVPTAFPAFESTPHK